MCNYPIRILPRRQYVDRINVNDLCIKCNQSVLLRRLDSEGKPFHIIGGRKLLNEGVISEDVLDWSTNLLGGEFKIEDICWRQKNGGIADWNGGDVKICDFDECYQHVETPYYVCIAVNRLHKITIPYKRRFGSRQDLEQYVEKTNDITKEDIAQYIGGELECRATITIEHKPTMLNYWHITIGITPRDFTDPMPRNSTKNKGVKKRVREALHLHIIDNVMCETPNIEDIPKELYLKTV